MYRTLIAILLLTLAGASRAEDGCRIEVEPYRELTIVDPLVVEDARANPGGPWHFSTLLRGLLPAGATDADVSDFVVRWLNGSKAATETNGFKMSFPGFALGERTVCNWLRESGGGHCDAVRVNPARAPYRLLAIVNRMDLDGHGPDHAEGRFVFGALSAPTADPVGDPSVFGQPETVIFEYRLPFSGPAEKLAWAKAWHALSDARFACTTKAGCEPLRKAIEELTRRFATRGTLGQIRTSHLALGSGRLWSFREFHLQGNDLVATPVAQTPHHALDNDKSLLDWIRANTAQVLSGSFVVPRNLLGLEALLDEQKPRQWALDGVDESVRRAFSGETCNGCHGEKAVLDDFFHVSPTAGAENAGKDRLSDFLKKEELPKRAASFRKLLCGGKSG